MVEIKKFRVADMETWECVPDLCENAGNQAAITTVLVARFDTAFLSYGLKRVEEPGIPGMWAPLRGPRSLSKSWSELFY